MASLPSTDETVPGAEPTLRPCRGRTEWPTLVEIWRSAVEATHHFLTPDDIDFYQERIASTYLSAVSLTVATLDDVAVGFSGVAGSNLEMLFIDNAYRGRGVGTALLLTAMAEIPDLRVDVNEQNPQAVGFYEHHGFVTAARSDHDADGRPFPILHLRRADHRPIPR
ncbi:acetyltransferase [Nocardia nova]|uniref:Acetyltransferase n=1 Tax=Nocardia nova TaxID=37330 RepID=A0A2S6AWC2_9NOCA|nr:acetyltransferase [Nocardia nova]PPJ33708.1 acetyltransferase [Nocardia nova]PPJ39503.1 acetyltransferase [Nocardia nova]